MANSVSAINGGGGRYDILDGLRGVAAVIVIWYHFSEGFARTPVEQMFNHGYLAVDFFFVLSGFVLSYAYGRRWNNGGLTAGGFMLRRIIRLQPMVVLSVVLGAVAFLIQGCERWDGSPVTITSLGVALLLGLFMIPVIPGVDAEVRGFGEMFPLNGPQWSLFFEYIGSLLYAIVLHRLSRRALKAVLAASGAGLIWCVLSNQSGFYHLGLGWSMEGYGFLCGFLRLSFSFTAGLLIQRCFRPMPVRGAFWLCSAIIALALACPYIGHEASLLNGCYDLLCTFIVFPSVVYIGACGMTTDNLSTRLCEFMGRLSYPIYIVHYPVMYLFYAWEASNRWPFTKALPLCCGLFVLITLMAWAAMRFYDTPIRRFISKKLA